MDLFMKITCVVLFKAVLLCSIYSYSMTSERDKLFDDLNLIYIAENRYDKNFGAVDFLCYESFEKQFISSPLPKLASSTKFITVKEEYFSGIPGFYQQLLKSHISMLKVVDEE